MFIFNYRQILINTKNDISINKIKLINLKIKDNYYYKNIYI